MCIETKNIAYTMAALQKTNSIAADTLAPGVTET